MVKEEQCRVLEVKRYGSCVETYLWACCAKCKKLRRKQSSVKS